MDIELSKKLTVKVYSNNKIVKQSDISKDEFASMMAELSEDRIEMLRECNKLFKVKTFKFKNVRI